MKRDAKLDKDQIVDAAIALIDAKGKSAFSMRKLAAVLDVDPMAIYHHHKSKSALMHSVMEEMLKSFVIPEPSGHWQKDIRLLCHGVRNLGLLHPGTFVVYETFEDWTPSEHRMNEAFYATLMDGGFSNAQAIHSVRLIMTFTEAFVLDELAGLFRLDDKEEYVESLQTGSFPALTALIEDMETTNAETSFDFALDVIIAGLEKNVPEQGTPAT